MKDEEGLKQRFSRAEQALIAALNGMGRSVASPDEIVELRRELLRIRHECASAGVAVETLEEYARRREAEERTLVREFAAEAMGVVPLMSRSLRKRLSAAVGICVCLLLISTGAAAWWAFAGGFCVWALVDVWSVQIFPTPAVRVARRACEAHVDVRDLWPEGSAEQKDYLEGYRMHMQRLRRRGDGPNWIKAN